MRTRILSPLACLLIAVVSGACGYLLCLIRTAEVAVSRKEFWGTLYAEAEQGDPNAMAQLGALYRDGAYGKGKDHVAASSWYLMAERSGYVGAEYNLGELYATGGDGLKRDYGEAAKWYLVAAHRGDADSQFKIAAMYERGEGPEKSYAAALFWLLLAIDYSEGPHAKYHDTRVFNKEERLSSLKAHLTPEQIAAIEKRVKDWKPTVASDKKKL